MAVSDILEGGLGYSDDARRALDERATKVERKRLAARIREAVPEASSWGREALGAWLLELEGDDLDDTQYLARCRELGLTRQLVTRMLDLKRVDEALREVARLDELELVTAADLLLHRRRGEEAERIVEGKYQRTRSRRLRDWLRAWREQRKDFAGVLDLALEAFRERPDLGSYRAVRGLAQKFGRWEALRGELRALLAKDRDATIRLLLEEGEHDAALAALDAKTTRAPPRGASGGVSYGGTFELEVAEAVKETHPARAKEVFLRHADALIEARNRVGYRQACELLGRAKALKDDAEAWRQYVAGLLARYPTHKAFREELARARL